MIFGAPPAALLGAHAGTFTGAMVGVGLLLAFLGFPEITPPRSLNQALQVFVGVLVGLRISRGSLAAGARTVLPATVLAALFLVSGVAALLSITGETDADLVRVAFTHLFRLSATIVVVPLLVTTMLA